MKVEYGIEEEPSTWRFTARARTSATLLLPIQSPDADAIHAELRHQVIKRIIADLQEEPQFQEWVRRYYYLGWCDGNTKEFGVFRELKYDFEEAH